MWRFFIENCNYIKLLIFLTFFVVLLFRLKKNKIHKILFCIVGVSTVNEVAAPILLYNSIPIGLSTTIAVIIHHLLWLLLIRQFFECKSFIRICIVSFLLFSIVNLVFFEGHQKFNSFTFVFGSLLYVFAVAIEIVSQLKNENLGFFSDNNFILSTAPILLMVALSLIFNFNHSDLLTSRIIFDFMLYDVISFFINIIYYGIIIYFILNERKQCGIKLQSE